MKYVLNLCLAAILFFSLASCSNNKPETAAIRFMEAMFDGDFEKAKEYASTDTKSMLSMMESFGVKDQFEDMSDDLSFKVIKTEIKDDRAICTLEMNEDGEKEEMPINLIKKEGEWLVDMDKEDMDKEDMNMDGLEKEDGNPSFDSEDEGN